MSDLRTESLARNEKGRTAVTCILATILFSLATWVPALTATWNSGSGELDITQGDASAIDLTVGVNAGLVAVTDNGSPISIINGPVDPADVISIDVNCYGGPYDDQVDLRGVTTAAGFTNPSKQSPYFTDVNLSSGNDTLHGSEFNDRSVGGFGNDTMYGYGGDDYLNGQGSNDVIYGGDGDDELHGHQNNDELYGEGGNDSLNDTNASGSGSDLMDGGEGNDTFDVNDGGDTVLCGGGNDVVDILAGDNRVECGPGNDAVNIDNTGSTGYRNTVYSIEGEDTITGGKSDDIVYVSARATGDVAFSAKGQTTADILYYDLAPVGLLAHELTIVNDLNTGDWRTLSGPGVSTVQTRYLNEEYVRPSAKMVNGTELELLLFTGGTTVTAAGGNVKVQGRDPEGGVVAANTITTITALASSDWRAENFIDFSGVDRADFTVLNQTFAALGYQDDRYVGGGAENLFYDSPTMTNQDQESGNDIFLNIGDGDIASGYTGEDTYAIIDDVTNEGAIGIYGGWQTDALIYDHRGLAYDNNPGGQSGAILPNPGETRIRSVWYNDIEDKSSLGDFNATPTWNAGPYADAFLVDEPWSRIFNDPADFSDADGDAVVLSLEGHQGPGDGAWLAFGAGASSTTLATTSGIEAGEHVFVLGVVDEWDKIATTTLALTVNRPPSRVESWKRY